MHDSPPRDGTSNDMSDWHNNHNDSFSFFELVFFLDAFQKQYDSNFARKLIECILLMHGRRICGALVHFCCYQHRYDC